MAEETRVFGGLPECAFNIRGRSVSLLKDFEQFRSKRLLVAMQAVLVAFDVLPPLCGSCPHPAARAPWCDVVGLAVTPGG